MSDYRDPKVTKPGQANEGGAGKWIGIAIAVLVVLLLLGWMLGWFAGETTEPVATDPAVIENSDVGSGTADPVVTQDPEVTTTAPVEEDPAAPVVVE